MCSGLVGRHLGVRLEALSGGSRHLQAYKKRKSWLLGITCKFDENAPSKPFLRSTKNLKLQRQSRLSEAALRATTSLHFERQRWPDEARSIVPRLKSLLMMYEVRKYLHELPQSRHITPTPGALRFWLRKNPTYHTAPRPRWHVPHVVNYVSRSFQNLLRSL